MNIGELFINLGINGTDKAVGALSSVTKGLGETKSMSLEAKAGILAAVYAFERMISASARNGMSLQQFANSTGLAVDKMQNLENATRQFGVSAEETRSTVKGIQNSITGALFGDGAPKALAIMKNFGVDVDFNKLKDEKEGPYYAIEKYQELAKKASPAILRYLFPGASVGDNMLGFFRKNTADLWHNNLGPVNSPQMIEALSKAQVAMLNLENKLAHGFDVFTAKHGQEVVEDIERITTSIFNLLDAVTDLAEKLKVFPLLSSAMENVAKSIENITGFLNTSEKKGVGAAVTDRVDKLLNAFPLPKVQHSASGHTTVSVGQQHLHFNHDGKDHAKIADAHKRGAQHAYRQNQAQGQGS